MTDRFTKRYEKLQRQNLRRVVHKIWMMLREGNLVGLDQTEQKLARIIMAHQEYQEHFEDEGILDGREYASAEGFNPFLHISLHQMVEDQLDSETPIEAILLCESLEMAGYSRHEAVHTIIMVLMPMIFDAYKSGKPFNAERYKKLLAKCRKVPPPEMQGVVERELTSN